ncbi:MULTISPECIES: glycosyltransferase family 2 protein [Microbacterium]|uniref:glycosyltransferase family 2 protein n=1 Tax=Microbacterium TaxID=33882 RepID=UPI00344DBA04
MSAEAQAWAVIVVNYGSSALLETNLVATVADARPDIVVLVDNPTTAEERDRVRALSAREGWMLVEPAANTGFGGGINMGVAAALEHGATGLLLLNPDARIDAASVRMLRAETDRDPLALCAPRVITPAGMTWFAGADVALSDGRTRARTKRSQYPDDDVWEWLTGACLWMTAALWRQTGGFDEDYFLYWEDVDLSRRVVLAGGSLVVAENAVAVHDEGATHREAGQSERSKSETYYYFNIRNRMLFGTRFLPREGIERWRSAVGASAWEVILRGGRAQLLRSPAPWRAYVRGVRDARRIADAALRQNRDVTSAGSH